MTFFYTPDVKELKPQRRKIDKVTTPKNASNIYEVNLRSQSEYRKIRTRNNSVFGHFSRSVYLNFFERIVNGLYSSKKKNLKDVWKSRICSSRSCPESLSISSDLLPNYPEQFILQTLVFKQNLWKMFGSKGLFGLMSLSALLDCKIILSRLITLSAWLVAFASPQHLKRQ